MTGIGLPDLVAQAYEAACDLDGLDQWVRRLAEYFGDVGVALVIWPLQNPDDLIVVTHGTSPEALREQFQHRMRSDSLFGKIEAMSGGETCIIEDALQDAHLSSDKEASNAKYRALVGVVVVDDVHRCCLTLLRDADRDDFSQMEIDSLQTLMGYFARAIALNRRFIDLFNQFKTASAVLDSAPRGIVAVGQFEQVTYLNSEAKRIFDQSDGLSLINNKVIFRDSKLRDRFSGFIEFACQQNEPQPKQERMNANIKRTSVTTPYQMMAYTLPFNKRQASLFEAEALAVLIIQDATTNLQLRSELLQTFYNLSTAEARLAVALYQGSTLPEAAGELHISVNTARSQLRGIFKKVGVNSQAALLQALASGVKDVTQARSRSSSIN